MSFAELQTGFKKTETDYAQWRKQRDTTNDVQDDQDKVATEQSEMPLDLKIYDYAFALAYINPEEGIKLLKHNLYTVRYAAASGLVNSDQFKPELLKTLEQEWLQATNPITKQSLFHTIDTALLALEGVGAEQELAFLHSYNPQLTDSRSIASIKPRVEWTMAQLQWRVDMNKDLDQMAKDQLPDLLKRACMNPDGTDISEKECTPSI